MKITEDHKLIKLGWTDSNFWDNVFDSTLSKEPTVEKEEKTNGHLFFSEIFEEDNDN
jgi:hypothetical protein